MPLRKAALHGLPQNGADGADIPLLYRAAHVCNRDARQCCTGIPLTQMQHGIFSGLCAIKRLNRRRCRAEQYKRIFLHRAVFRHIPRMIARTVFGFVGIILFFVQNDKPQILRRCEYCRPCADNYASFSGTNSFPAVVSFSDRQSGVQHGCAAAKLRHKFANQLRRQADFRYKDNRAFSGL